ncbi:MAG TPA: YggS family pyridoxal phosphate-dependent enzyme, partial [Bacteroidales bacterium]|nr:YggS family pyridoxal phosphate-dependent enzyme [Bacteroidales bacterium]
MSITDNLIEIKKKLPDHVRLIAVSKTKPAECILELYQYGQRIFGENRVQEITEKYQQLPSDIEWHFIGHLQTNKVKFITPFISFIHSIDSLKLLNEINKEAQKNNRVINCLLEMYIATEETKFGLDLSESIALLESPEYKKMNHIRICGVM